MHVVGASAAADPLEGPRKPGVARRISQEGPAQVSPRLHELAFDQVLPGVSLLYSVSGTALEFRFVLQPGADAGALRLRFSGGAPALDGHRLVISTPLGDIVYSRPFAIQDGRLLGPADYRVESDGSIAFSLPPHDASRPLTIDPIIYASTTNPPGVGISVDANGNAYIAEYSARRVTKLSPSGAFLWSTYLGDAAPASTATDGSSVYVTGDLNTGTLPVTPNAYQSTPANPNGMGADAFLLKLDAATGGTVQYGSYLGGTIGGGPAANIGHKVEVGTQGVAYLAGFTNALTNFPTTAGAFQSSPPPAHAVMGFVARLPTAGAGTPYVTYIRHVSGAQNAGSAYIAGLAVDSSGKAFVTGHGSGDFPITMGSAPTGFAPVVLVLNPSGSGLVYSRFIGPDGSGYNNYGIGVDANGNACATGTTTSSSFPATQSAIQSSQPFPGENGYVVCLDSAGGITYSSYLGSSAGPSAAKGLAMASAGRIVVVGQVADAAGFPTTTTEHMTSASGSYAYVTVIDPSSPYPAYSAPVGGGGSVFYEVATLGSCDVFATGSTSLGETIRLDACPPTFTWSPTLCPGRQATFTATPPSGQTFSSITFDWGDPTPDTTVTSPPWEATHAFASAGTYTVQLTAQYVGGGSAAFSRPVPVAACPTPDFSWSPTPCPGRVVTFTALPPPSGFSFGLVTFAWGDATPSTTVAAAPWQATHTYAGTGTYTVQMSVTYSGGGSASRSHAVPVAACAAPSFSWSPTPCEGRALTFTATPAPGHTFASATFDWGDASPPATLTGAPWQATHTYPTAGTYTVTLSATYASNGGSATVSQSVSVPACPAPTLSFTPATYCVGTQLTFTPAPPPGHSFATVQWAWGDGQTSNPPLPGVATHSYAAAATYTVTLTVTYTGGGEGTATRSVPVGACPAPSFSWGPATHCVGSRLTFTGTPPPGYTMQSASWSWGDNTPGSTGSPAVHRFMASGSYTVTLTMAYSGGGQATTSRTVTISPCPSPSFAVELECGTVRVYPLAPTGYTGAWAHWDWGDATSSTVGPPWQASATHAYAQDGTYQITLTAHYTDGAWSSAQRMVTIDTCRRTYAAGAAAGDGAFVIGNDPGCGLGDAGSFVPADAQSVLHLAPGPSLSPIQPLPLPTFLQAAGFTHTQPSSPFPLLVSAGGTHDCRFTPSDQTAMAKFDGHSFLLDRWVLGPRLNQARIAPAYATVRQTEGVYVAGGDGTGGSPLDPSQTHAPTASVEFLRPDVNPRWIPVESMPAGVVGAAGAHEECGGNPFCPPGGPDLFVVSGGFSHSQTANAAIQVLDEGTSTWQGPHLPDPAYVTAHQGEACNGRRWVLGGMGGEEAPMHNIDTGLITSRVWRASSTTPWPSASPWSPAGNLPIGLAYHQAAVWQDRIIVYGGVDATGAVTNGFMVADCPAAGAPSFTSMPALLRPALMEAAMEAGAASLYVFGGTSSTATGPGGLLGGCPSNAIHALQPMTGVMVALPTTLPVATASMGSATLPDGRIILVGGRVQAGATCHAPTARVLVFDPVTLQLCQGPALPVGLIAPAVAVSGSTIFVAGGDDRGDAVAPVSATDARPRHPSSRMYTLGAANACAASASWTDTGVMPMGVVHGQAIPMGSGLWVVGGNHHPERAVRMVQPFEAATMAWQHPMLPESRAHHALLSCLPFSPSKTALGGVTSGSTVYLTLPGQTSFAADALVEAAPGAWTQVPDAPRAFPAPIPASGYPPRVATGTTDTLHRTADAIALPC
jgi:PKD repeat protein